MRLAAASWYTWPSADGREHTFIAEFASAHEIGRVCLELHGAALCVLTTLPTAAARAAAVAAAPPTALHNGFYMDAAPVAHATGYAAYLARSLAVAPTSRRALVVTPRPSAADAAHAVHAAHAADHSCVRS